MQNNAQLRVSLYHAHHKPCFLLLFHSTLFRAKNDDVGKKILQTLIEKRPKFAEYFGIQSDSLDIRALNQSKEFHLQVSVL